MLYALLLTTWENISIIEEKVKQNKRQILYIRLGTPLLRMIETTTNITFTQVETVIQKRRFQSITPNQKNINLPMWQIAGRHGNHQTDNNMSKHIQLIGIDIQNDFCDPTKGTLYVAGADRDAANTANLINRLGDKLDALNLTMDSHQITHIAHPGSWVDKDGNHPLPFTLITKGLVADGTWKAADPRKQSWFKYYVDSLEENGRYVLCIWPPHCLIGSWGHNLVPSVWEAQHNWSKNRNIAVNYVTKGSCDFSEHYSAVQADVPVDWDPSTRLNTRLIDSLQEADELIITGEALSHCVANTMRDIVKNFGAAQVAKLVFLSDCSSSVTGFNKLGEDFVKELTALGMRTTTSVDYLA